MSECNGWSDAFTPNFEQWLKDTHPTEFGADVCLTAAYPPRRFFGEYVNAMLEDMSGRPGITLRSGVEVVGLEALPTRAVRHRYRLTLQFFGTRGFKLIKLT